jgi:ankyrin repeat protein
LKSLLHDVLCAQVQCVDHKGRSALFIAVQFRHVETVKALVELGADAGWRDVNGTCPLTVAAYIGDVKMCETLLSLGAEAISFVSGCWFFCSPCLFVPRPFA